jgi:CMP-N-acetylneuraminic acid synthetase
MKNIDDVLFIIQARLNSQRVPQKMIRDFNGTNLFSIAIDKVLDSNIIPKDNFYVSVCEDELIEIAEKKKINIYKRSYESANNDNSLQMIYEWHDKLPFKYVVKINGCSPLLKSETIDGFVKQFIEQDEENLFGVIETKDYYWNKDGKLVTPWPENQTIMNTKAVEVTYKAAHVLYASKLDLIRDNKFMGNFEKEGGIKLYPMDELECFDIDYDWQFKLGEILWKN